MKTEKCKSLFGRVMKKLQKTLLEIAWKFPWKLSCRFGGEKDHYEVIAQFLDECCCRKMFSY